MTDGPWASIPPQGWTDETVRGWLQLERDRLQLERDGESTSYSARDEIDEASLLARAPDLEIAGNRVRAAWSIMSRRSSSAAG